MKEYLIDVDFSNTKKQVDQIMKKYKYYLLSVSDEPILVKDNKIIITYNEEIVKFIKEKERYEEKKSYVEWVSKNINKLDDRSRKIIIHSYFEEEKDDVLANRIGYTRCYFYTLKKEAIITLAYALNIEVLKEVTYEGN